MWLGAVTLMVFSTAPRSVTGPANVTITGWATPTTAPLAGWIEAMAGLGVGGAIAATAGAADAAKVSTAVDAASQPARIALPTVSTLRDDARPPLAFRISQYCPMFRAANRVLIARVVLGRSSYRTYALLNGVSKAGRMMSD